jgi:hypothetical protein
MQGGVVSCESKRWRKYFLDGFRPLWQDPCRGGQKPRSFLKSPPQDGDDFGWDSRAAGYF